MGVCDASLTDNGDLKTSLSAQEVFGVILACSNVPEKTLHFATSRYFSVFTTFGLISGFDHSLSENTAIGSKMHT